MGRISAFPKREKERLRKELFIKRASLLNRGEKSQKILEQLLSLPLYRSAKWLLLYISVSEEPDTYGLLREALKEGKKVYAPVCDVVKNRMAFYQIGNEQDLRPGSFHIPEPDPSRCGPVFSPLRSQGEGLLIAPGLAFDLTGARLGYGKGYYDRFLAECPMPAAGLCYRELLLPRLPAEIHDQRVDMVVTEKGVFACSAPSARKGNME